MRLKLYFFLEMSFHLIFEVLLAKTRKNLQLENLENLMEKPSILKKKRFDPSKRHI